MNGGQNTFFSVGIGSYGQCPDRRDVVQGQYSVYSSCTIQVLLFTNYTLVIGL